MIGQVLVIVTTLLQSQMEVDSHIARKMIGQRLLIGMSLLHKPDEGGFMCNTSDEWPEACEADCWYSDRGEYMYST